ncbi:hypothetical protein [Brevundimonas albigilva]|uniref:Uncharacterized protein n=1 Tax=Brevundimonas albigilva TaxID=1312364 RepID=A0ABY4SNV3_9CAUL|nr:hypothetical protein [Brevundimonas albigilva]URI15929.1 hypothetical protein M8231_02755 [Brevundimonas albigilva]
MSDLKTLIETAIALVPAGENSDFALFYVDGAGPKWSAEMKNPCAQFVMLGEASGEYGGEGDTPEQAVLALISRVQKETGT